MVSFACAFGIHDARDAWYSRRGWTEVDQGDMEDCKRQSFAKWYRTVYRAQEEILPTGLLNQAEHLQYARSTPSTPRPERAGATRVTLLPPSGQN